MKNILIGIFAISIFTLNSSFAQNSEFLMPAKKYGKWGFINKSGEEVIPFKYELVSYFIEGFAKVSLGGKSGFIDSAGTEIIPLKYDTQEVISFPRNK